MCSRHQIKNSPTGEMKQLLGARQNNDLFLSFLKTIAINQKFAPLLDKACLGRGPVGGNCREYSASPEQKHTIKFIYKINQ